MPPTGRPAHRACQLARYCLFDFDLSIIVPVGIRHLQSRFARAGSPWNHPMDIEQGEPYYNPFAYDVASMGNMLSTYNYLTPTIPLLAPLLDRMTTHVVANRFTALEAWQFCQFIQRTLPIEELYKPLPSHPVDYNSGATDRWKDLLADFVATWSAYHEISPSFATRVLRWIGSSNLGWKILTFVRRLLQI